MAIAVVTISRARTLNRSKGLFRVVFERQGTYPLPMVDSQVVTSLCRAPIQKANWAAQVAMIANQMDSIHWAQIKRQCRCITWEHQYPVPVDLGHPAAAEEVSTCMIIKKLWLTLLHFTTTLLICQVSRFFFKDLPPGLTFMDFLLSPGSESHVRESVPFRAFSGRYHCHTNLAQHTLKSTNGECDHKKPNVSLGDRFYGLGSTATVSQCIQ